LGRATLDRVYPLRPNLARLADRARRPLSVILAATLAACAPATSATRPDPTPLIVYVTPAPTPIPTPAPTSTPIVIFVSPSPSPTPTRPPTPTPPRTFIASPGVLTLKQAARAYLAVAKPFNASLDSADKKYGAADTDKGQRALWVLVTKATDKFIAGVKAIRFPRAASVDAKVLLRQLASFRQKAHKMSTDTSATSFDVIEAVFKWEDSSIAATKLRHHLGLSRPPTDRDGFPDLRF
jgi:hypothetical protein